MNKKLIIIPFILFVLLLSVTAISAADLNDTDNLDILKDTSTDKSFSDLNLQVQSEDTNISLESNYKYNNESDQDYVGGNNINKNNFVITGNNHIIDCNNQARAFNITGKKVEINNLVIKNAVYTYGSAITTDSKLILNNVTFINCQGSGKESVNLGAIFSKEGDVNINNCKFIDTSGYEGASITAYSSEVTVANSTFISSSDKIVKGHVYVFNSNLTITNSSFLNTTSKYAAALFGEEEGIIDIENSTFKNLFANMTAGAIGTKLVPRLYVLGCEFDNVSSENNGGAIFADINGNKNKQSGLVEIDGAKFSNCHSDFGGAILQLGGELYVYNSNFTSNRAAYEGGAIYTSFANVSIINSTFASNRVSDEMSYGGACYFDMGKVDIEKSNFQNNLGSDVTTIYAYDTILTLENSYFNNPSNVTSLYSVYGKVIKDAKTNFTTDKYSFGNTNYFYNFENTANPFTIVNGTLPFDKLPEKFDLRDYGWVSPVKDQGFDGACWMFGNLAALESALMRYANVTYSLSVNNAQNSMVQYSKYGQIGVVEGGNDFGAVSYLIDWLGVFPEEYDGYDELGKISSLFITPEDIRIENAVFVPKRTSALDNNLIKEALIKYGAVSASHRADFNNLTYFNTTASAQYYYGKAKASHKICVVGWDDNYPKENFLKTAPGNGAWICKNSWGTDWGDNGYFYISYYDLSFASDDNIAYIITNDTYNRIYQHDVGGGQAYYTNVKYYYNNFTADEDELIAAVGTYFNRTGQNYKFTIYVNDVPVYNHEGVSKFRGYETIKLDKYVQIKKGDSFVVAFNNQLYVADHLRIPVQKGQSFYSADGGKTWIDLAKNGDVAILKAYTISDLNITKSLVKYYKNDTPFIAEVGPGEEVIFEFNGANHTVKADENGLAKFDIDCNVGNYVIATTYKNMTIVNSIVIKSTIVSSDVDRGLYSNYDYKLQVLDSAGNPLNNTKVSISVNGKSKIYTSDNSGYITLKFTKLATKQIIKVVNPSNAETKTSKIVVFSRFADEKNVKMYYYDGSKFTAYILGDNAKAVGANQVVTIKLNKKTYKVKTNSKGLIAFKIPSTVKPGTYKITATYKGETIKKTIKVYQNLKTKKYTVKKSAKKLVVKATLKNGKTALKNKKVTLKLNGKTFRAKTNKYGIAKFTIKKNIIKKLKAGKKYTMKVTYLKNTIKTTLKVKR